jgi:hypothetical protein
MFYVERATYLYQPIDEFAKVEFVKMFYIERATYIY